MEIFGWALTDLFLIAGTVFGAVYAYFRINNSSVDLKDDVTKLEKRVEQLEYDHKVASGSWIAASTSLTAIQGQLSTLSNRFDTLISQLISKDKNG